MTTKVFLNGKLLDPNTGNLETTNIVVANSTVIGMGYVPDENEDEIEKIELAGKIILPNITDVYTSVGEPGFSENETLKTMALAAAHGGVSRIVSAPDVSPVIDNTEKLAGFLNQSADIEIYPIISATLNGDGTAMAELARLKAIGSVAASDFGITPPQSLLSNMMRYLTMIQMPLISPVFSKSTIGKGQIHDGVWSTILGLPGISIAQEVSRISHLGEWAAETGCPVIVLGVSSESAIDVIRHMKYRGIPIFAGVSIHSCWLTDQSADGFDSNAKVLPPLRTESDQQAIRTALTEGGIDFIYADHKPWVLDRKRDDFVSSEFGMSTLDCYWPLVFTRLVKEWDIPLAQAYSLVSTSISQLFGLPNPTLSIGSDANFTVFDPNASQPVLPDKWYSKGKNSAYFGKTLYGWPEFTVLKGQVSNFK